MSNARGASESPPTPADPAVTTRRGAERGLHVILICSAYQRLTCLATETVWRTTAMP